MLSGPRKGGPLSCVESLLLEQNPTLIYLRNVKSFVFRAGRKVPHCQKWDCHALPLFALDRAISRLFSISILILSRSLYRSHVLSTFFDPVLGAMMKQVCWHSRRSEAHRGLPEARPRTQNVMARGQSEAHGDSNVYNTRQD